MSLAVLLNPPLTERGMMEWSFNNQDSHDRIVGAILTQKNNTLQNYIMDPIQPNDFQNWLRRHQNAHDQMNGALALTGSDLTDVDWSKSDQRAAWIRLHYNEHQLAHITLGI